MRSIILLASVFLMLSPALRAAQTSDPVLTKGLQVYMTNGLEACLWVWYADRPKLAAEMKDKVSAVTKDFGDVIDTEIVAVQPVSKRITRYYVGIYFTRRPLWLRVERYTGSDNKSFYLPLKFSVEADDILPGYLTDFVQ
jgi:hypothetical protein